MEAGEGDYFASAPLPDVVLGAQKDDSVLRSFRDSCSDAVAACLSGSSLGERLAPLLTPEINFLATLLYYSATLLGASEMYPYAGQTLGDEYTGIVLSQRRRGPFGGRRRLALTILISALPYVWARYRAGGYSQIERTLRYRTARQQAMAMRAQMSQRAARAREQQEDAPRNNSVLSLLAYIWARAPSAARVREAIGLIQRAHLGIFYLNGRYHTLAERALGCERVAVSEPDFGRPSYAILGYLIFVELGMRGISQMRRIVSSIAAFLLARRNRTAYGHLDAESYPSDRSTVADIIIPSEIPSSNSANAVTIQCGVCLEVPTRPACTQCGHVFCFECILSAAKLMQCPTCRQPSSPNEIQCLYANGEVA